MIYLYLKGILKEMMLKLLNEKLAESYLNCLREIKNKYDIRDDISVTNSQIPRSYNSKAKGR